MPPILHAQITTERASRYLVQFCKHAAAIGDGGHGPRMHLHTAMDRRDVRVTADWSDTSGTVTFTPWGRCTLTADGDTLTVRIEATDEDGLTRIRDVIDRDLQRFSRRDPLSVSWQQPPGAAPFRPTPAMTSPPRRGAPRTRLRTILLPPAAVLVIALHVGAAGTAVAHSRWTGIAVDAMVALVALKIASITWAHYTGRRRAVGTPITPVK
ncbi:DUF2218 domain-containing protein [Actinoplanes subtropicus]|uniref:DUF2218 domain-containing protein n=1 Tax=Actinoplanes subtropicus TaxID=543632 RepID=UPI000690246B|nr:DUF2218 domain-containing protein [Actinoplanes subtropicus]